MQIPVLQKGCVMFITMTNEIKEKVRNKTFLTLHTKLVDSFFCAYLSPDEPFQIPLQSPLICRQSQIELAQWFI